MSYFSEWISHATSISYICLSIMLTNLVTMFVTVWKGFRFPGFLSLWIVPNGCVTTREYLLPFASWRILSIKNCVIVLDIRMFSNDLWQVNVKDVCAEQGINVLFWENKFVVNAEGNFLVYTKNNSSSNKGSY